jgi:thiamine-phosphate pyrophosphorylase
MWNASEIQRRLFLGLLLPRLYVILDAGVIQGQIHVVAEQLLSAGVCLLQYRGKNVAARSMLETSKLLTGMAHKHRATFFVNDRPDVAWLAGADGVHVGQDDLSVNQARSLVGEGRWVGVSTHNHEQFEKAAATSADYIAIGPIFQTSSKANPDPIVGTEMIRQVRRLTPKPIVAIGGIRLENAAEVIEAGADSIAVIRDIVGAADPAKQAEQFLNRLEAIKQPGVH